MKNRILTALTVLLFSVFGMDIDAQNLQTTTWNSYGISFKAPEGFNVEDDSEEGYIISTPAYFITVQLLEGEGIKKSELSGELKNIANDDEVSNQTLSKRSNSPNSMVHNYRETAKAIHNAFTVSCSAKTTAVDFTCQSSTTRRMTVFPVRFYKASDWKNNLIS